MYEINSMCNAFWNYYIDNLQLFTDFVTWSFVIIICFHDIETWEWSYVWIEQFPHREWMEHAFSSFVPDSVAPMVKKSPDRHVGDGRWPTN